MNMILRLMVLFLLVLQTACVRPPVCPACRAACDRQANVCHQTCRNYCAQCSAFADQSAARHFLDYRHEKAVEGGTIARCLRSYRDPLQCRKVTCNCQADYQSCIQACGGVIQKRLQVAPVC